MTTQEIKLVKTSWKTFRSIDPAVIGDVFYSKLFFDHPQLKALFRIPVEEQSKKLIDMLNIIVGRLDKQSEMSADIEALASRHVHYGVKPAHYKAVGEALLWTLQKGLGNDWADETKAAWETCFNQLAGVMIGAAYS